MCDFCCPVALASGRRGESSDGRQLGQGVVAILAAPQQLADGRHVLAEIDEYFGGERRGRPKIGQRAKQKMTPNTAEMQEDHAQRPGAEQPPQRAVGGRRIDRRAARAALKKHDPRPALPTASISLPASLRCS